MKDDHGKSEARAQLASILEMVAVLDRLRQISAGISPTRFDTNEEEARTAIEQDPLSVLVRSDFHDVGIDTWNGGEAEILLSTGGPACRIIVQLDEHHEPESVRMEYQDRGTPWTEYRLTTQEHDSALEYSRCFFYGE